MIAGLTVEVRDLEATDRFYRLLLAEAAGTWTEASRRIAFETDSQRIELVQRARPRAHGELGRHLAIRVPGVHLQRLVAELSSLGRTSHLWREDHPAERTPTTYVEDPSGNLIQLMPSDGAGPLLDHVMLPVDDLEAADHFYRKALGGVLDHYHAWRMTDVHEARAWAAGDDPCAPWTRMTKFSRVSGSTITSAIPQIYLALGPTRVGLVVSTKHIQEPPEGLLRGTPTILLRTSTPAEAVAAHLAEVDIGTAATMRKVNGVPFEREDRRFYLRDPSGHFAVLECAS